MAAADNVGHCPHRRDANVMEAAISSLQQGLNARARSPSSLVAPFHAHAFAASHVVQSHTVPAATSYAHAHAAPMTLSYIQQLMYGDRQLQALAQVEHAKTRDEVLLFCRNHLVQVQFPNFHRDALRNFCACLSQDTGSSPPRFCLRFRDFLSPTFLPATLIKRLGFKTTRRRREMRKVVFHALRAAS